MPQNSDYTWYLEPLNKMTNDSLAQALPEDNFQPETETADGSLHNLWKCDSTVVSAYRNSKSRSGYQFRIYNRYGMGPIRECHFLKRKRKPRLSTTKPPQ